MIGVRRTNPTSAYVFNEGVKLVVLPRKSAIIGGYLIRQSVTTKHLYLAFVSEYLHRIEREAAEPDIEPPLVAVFRAVASPDVGETTFTETEFEAIQSVLAEYHYSTDWWEVERAQLETLLYEVAQVRQIASHPEAI